MANFFNKDTLKNTGASMFDDEPKKEKINNEDPVDYTEVLDELDEKEITEEDVKLAELGMQCTYGDLYKKHNPRYEVFSKAGKINKRFFQYYLDNCDADMLSYIARDKLPAPLQKMLDEAEPITVVEEIEEGTLESYIDKNAELIKQVSELEKYKQYTKFLFGFMSKKMNIFNVKELEDFINDTIHKGDESIDQDDILGKILEIKTSIEITDDEIDMISIIKEAIS